MKSNRRFSVNEIIIWNLPADSPQRIGRKRSFYTHVINQATATAAENVAAKGLTLKPVTKL
jgi:hypothetical protein